MTRRASVLSVAVWLAVFALPAAAEDFWGRKLPDQPQIFFFGYGSLINAASRNATSAKPVHAIPVRVSAAFGYVRCWCFRSASGFSALGIRRAGPGDAMTINGVLYPAEGNDIAKFDLREVGYKRVEVPREQIEALGWERLPEQGTIYVYVPIDGDKEPGVDLPGADVAFPILQSYIDVVVEGGLEYGTEYAREIIATTTGWSVYWLNDRELARRPWVFNKQAVAVDALLADAPHFHDRSFQEAYPPKGAGPR